MLEEPEIGLAITRTIIGLLFLAHGLDILTVGMGRTTQFFTAFKVPIPKVSTVFAGVLQTAGGVAMIAGFYAQVAAWALVLLMLAAVYFVHGRFGFPNINIIGQTNEGYQLGMPGFEFNLALIAGLLVVAVGGPGAWAVT